MTIRNMNVGTEKCEHCICNSDVDDGCFYYVPKDEFLLFKKCDLYKGGN